MTKVGTFLQSIARNSSRSKDLNIGISHFQHFLNEKYQGHTINYLRTIEQK